MEYMVARKNLRVSKKKATKKFNEDKLEEAEASKRPRKVKTTPKKGVTNNQSPSAKQSETHLPTPTTQQGAHRPPELLRGLSLTDFFTENAGLQEEIQVESMDSFGNPLAREYDLGLESAFGIFSIIMFSFHNEHGVFWQSIQALQEKGFRTYLAGTEEEFLRELPKYDEAWFASDKSSPSTHDPKKFLEAIKTFREKSGSLYILAENRPFFVQANEVLPELLGFTLEDNTPGGNVLSVTQSKIPAPKTFCKHLITTGLVSLYEGHTICRPSSLPARESLTVIGMSSDGYPCFICCDYEGHKGRIVVDCGFTKLCDEWWNQTAGTGRFVRNVAVWLTGLDHRAKIGAPPTGPLPITQPQGTAASTEASTTTTIEQTPAVTQAIETTTSSSELPPPSSASPGLGGDTTQKVEVTPLEITPETTEPKTAHCVEVPTKSND
ncbi:type III restriction enzyme [Pelomyxa schiedti]|nr:type III restriction enzyme [Pelomyxa schiedti]